MHFKSHQAPPTQLETISDVYLYSNIIRRFIPAMSLMKYIMLTVYSHTKLKQIFKIYLSNKLRRDIIYHQALYFNRLTPNEPHMGRTAPLTSKRCILYIYSWAG